MKRREDDGFTAHVLDLLAPWSEVVAKRMFGGIGLFAHGRMFAIIIDDVLYLKDSKDADGVPVKTEFEKEYFEYDRNGKTVNLGYFKAPEAALEESDYLTRLANESFRSASLPKTKQRSKSAAKAQKKKITSARPGAARDQR